MDNLYDAMVDVESGGNPLAASIKGARGLMQVTQPALTDYNKSNKTTLTMDDLWNEKTNRQVGEWYMGYQIPRMLRAIRVQDNAENRLWAYNAGIGNVMKGRKPRETVYYIRKVRERLVGGEKNDGGRKYRGNKGESTQNSNSTK